MAQGNSQENMYSYNYFLHALVTIAIFFRSRVGTASKPPLMGIAIFMTKSPTKINN